jgi:hypothetical protein
LSKERADHADADLLIKVYDLRREAVMRESRLSILRDFWPGSFEDVQALSNRDHPHNAAYRQTGTYWEMVYSFVRHGIVNPAFWLENNGEGMYLYVKIEPYLARIRETNPVAFQNAEWVATSSPEGRALYERIKARVAQLARARG